MRRWRCEVCGYIHEGEAPPETCPVCGAPKEEFVEIEGEDDSGGAGSSTAVERSDEREQDDERERGGERERGLLGWMAREHSHAIAVHVPNGVLPVATLFLVLGSLFAAAGMSTAAQYNMIAVLLAMPFVMFSGYVDWQAHYGGVMTRPILIKIICGGIVFGVSLLIVLWWQRDAASIRSDWMLTSIFVLLHLVALGAAAVAGYLGGRLAFGAGRPKR